MPKATSELPLEATGQRVFYCNGGKLDTSPSGRVDGELYNTNVTSKDGQWTGNLINRESDGAFQFTITNANGTMMTVVTGHKPAAKHDAPNGSSLTWDRRKVQSYGGPDPKPTWVVRTDTKSKPVPTSCKGDIDVYVPFTATYTIVAC